MWTVVKSDFLCAASFNKCPDAVSGIIGGNKTQSLQLPDLNASFNISSTNIQSKSFPSPAKQQAGLKTWKS